MLYFMILKNKDITMTSEFNKKTLITKIADYISSKAENFSKENHSDTSFSRLGLDSADHVQLSAIVEEHLKIEVEPTLAFDYPTINSMISFLEKKLLCEIDHEQS